MSLSLEITLPDGGRRRLSPAPPVIRVGRAPDNDVVILDATISGHHLLIQSTGDRATVHDLGSRNGTWVCDRRVDSGPAPLTDGAELRLGPDVRLRVHIELPTLTAAPRPAAFLWSVAQGRCLPVADGVDIAERFGVELPEGPYLLRLRPGGAEVHDGDEVLCAPACGEPFQVGPHRFVLVDTEAAFGQTATVRTDTRWHLRVDLSSRAGPTIEVRDPTGALRGTVQAATRVILLYLLAEQAEADAAAQRAISEAGWADDEWLARRLWGKSNNPRGGASLQVLIHRLRKDLSNLGLAGGIIEKRAGWTRLAPAILDVERVGAAAGAR